MRVPARFGNPAACFLNGQAYLAGTSIGSELRDGEQVKVVCAPSEIIDASIPMLTAK